MPIVGPNYANCKDSGTFFPLGILGLAQICSRRFQDGIALLERCLTSARLSGVGMVFCWQQPQTKACWIVLGLITPWHCYSFADNNPDLFMNWRALSWGYWKSWGIFLGDSGDWNIGASNFPLNLAKLAEYNPFDPTQSPSSCWHKYSLCWHNYSTNSACVCVCPICVFFGDSQWEKDHDSTSTCCTCSRDPIPLPFWIILVELQSPEITRDHQRSPESPESPVTSRYWSATANSWMPWDMPSARWRTWRKLLKGLGAMKADQAAWLWMFEVLNIFLRTQMIASNTRMVRIALGIQVR